MIITRVGAALLAAGLLAIPQQPTFRAGAYTVAVYTTVTDASGRLVPDLGRDEFEVYDNGKLQKITTFANDIQPINVVMMLDRSVSMRQNFDLVRKAAEAFVERLLPADKARIGSFSNRVQVDPREFTSDKSELQQILQTELQEEGPTPLWNAVSVGMTALLHVEGRRVVLVFTDGMDSPMPSTNNVTFRDIGKRAEQEDVMVYAIGLAGQTSFGHGPSHGPGGTGGGGYGGGGYGGGGYGGGSGRGGYGGHHGRGGQMDRPDPGLEKLAAESGGGYFELTSTNDLASTFSRVADELHHQYVLGFEPEKLDGKMHRLEVRLKQTGMTPRARHSYVAAKPESRSSLSPAPPEIASR
jgi:Ca-activated chloride channel family protein